MKGELETNVRRAALQTGGKALFLLAMLAVLREGIELALFFTAASFAADPQQALTGALLGLGIYSTKLNVRRSRKLILSQRSMPKSWVGTFGGLLDSYRADDAEIIIVTMGSVVGTIKDAIDQLRSEGKKVGLVKVRSYRPFPAKALMKELENADAIAVIEKDLCVGNEAALLTDIKAALYNSKLRMPIIGFTAGLGGRDITIKDIRKAAEKEFAKESIESELEFLTLRKEIL